MAGDFVDSLTRSLSTPGRHGVVLGCKDHGAICLQSLANAYPKLVRLGIRTVLVEGFRDGDEAERGYKPAFDRLQLLGLKVRGIENDNTLRFAKEVVAATDQAGKAVTEDDEKAAKLILQVMDQAAREARMPAANMDWAQQFRDADGKVVLCCGASHLPRHQTQNVDGLIQRLGAECDAYAVVEGSYAYDTYVPEREKPGEFGAVEWISACPP